MSLSSVVLPPPLAPTMPVHPSPREIDESTNRGAAAVYANDTSVNWMNGTDELLEALGDWIGGREPSFRSTVCAQCAPRADVISVRECGDTAGQ